MPSQPTAIVVGGNGDGDGAAGARPVDSLSGAAAS
jgi:hypothetical protein